MYEFNEDQFIKDFTELLNNKFAISVADASSKEYYQTLGTLVSAYYSTNWKNTWKQYDDNSKKQTYYFSIEFLPGKMLRSNLLNMGILEPVTKALKKLGIALADVAAVEPDMALGNGGLGRLASCFMDSLASCGLPGNGNGIRYQYGLFKQRILDGYQVELPNEWLNGGNVWEIRRESKSVDVRFGGSVYLREDERGVLEPVYENTRIVRAVPYDMGMVGYHNDCVNTLRLWESEIPAEEEDKYRSIEGRRMLEDLTSTLYPDDSTESGRRLRLSQEYFFVSAGIQSIIRHYLKLDKPLSEISEFIAIHINDTHPAMCIPEFMRLLIDENQMAWEQAWTITCQVMSYTNHTILAEALEKWPVALLQSVQPRIYQIIEEIDRRFVAKSLDSYGWETIDKTRIIKDGQVQMAHLAIIGSHSTNGVAKLHTELLKKEVLKEFYSMFPERFNNKTNGIAQRRWSQLANPEMSQVLDDTIGTSWRQNPNDLLLLRNFQDDQVVLDQLAQAKKVNKEHLAQYIKETLGIVVPTNAIFDVQIKRLHAYKRQLLNLLHIIALYQELKEKPTRPLAPRVFIFGAKAAPSYQYAKAVIKVINEVANLVNHDPAMKGKLAVVFLENYNVSLAELIIPAADVSEQISLASKEASGTSNMKLMLNGAVTLATLDGANIEIKDAVGADQIVVFGLNADQVYHYYSDQSYSAQAFYNDDPILKRAVDALIDGTIPNILYEGHGIYDSLLKYNDEFFVLADFAAYVEAQEKMNQLYLDQKQWQKISLLNIAHAGRFSSDQTVQRYAEEIWQITPLADKYRGKRERYDNYLL